LTLLRQITRRWNGVRSIVLRRSTTWLLLAITLLALVLRSYHIAASSLWADESYSVWVSAKPSLAAIWRWTWLLDARPPLYYWLLHCWMTVGDSEGAVRLLSAICGTLTVPVVYGIGCILGGRNAGLATALLIAISPVSVHFSQEARMYSLLPLAASVSMLGLARLLDLATRAESGAASSSMPWVVYVAGTAVALWVHYPAVLLPVSASVAVLLAWPYLARPMSFFRTWIVVHGILIALCAPLAPLYIHQSRGANRPPIAPIDSRIFFEGLSPDLTVFSRWLSWFQTARTLEILVAVIVTIFALRTWKYRGPWLALWLTPLIGAFLISAAWRPVFYPKVLVWITTPYYALVAVAITDLRIRPVVRAAIVAGLLAVVVLGLAAVYWTQPEYEAWKPTAQYVAESARPDDIILFNDSYVQLPFDYYFHRHRVSVVEQGVPTTFGATAVDEPMMTPTDIPALRRLTSQYRRLWLVYSHDWYTDPHHLILNTLDQSAQLIRTQSFPSQEPIKIMLYESQP
jgi:mannosyltransferase